MEEAPPLYDQLENLDDPALAYVVNQTRRLDNGSMVVEGTLEQITANIRMQDGAEVRLYGRVNLSLPIHFIIKHVEAEMRGGGNGLFIVEQIARQFGRQFTIAGYELLIEHNETVTLFREGQRKTVPAKRVTGKDPSGSVI